MENKRSSVKRLLAASKRGKARIAVSAILMFLSSICSLAPFYIAYLIIDKAMNPPFVATEFYRLGWVAAAFMVLQIVLSGIAMKQSHIAAYTILYDLRVRLAKKMLKLPLGYYSNTSSGIIKKVMMGDIEAIEEFLAHNLVDLASAVFLPLLIFVWLATFNLPLALLSIVPTILGVAIQRIRMKIDAKKTSQFFKLKANMNVTIIDFIRGMPLIKAFNQSVHSFKKYREEADAYRDFWIDWNKSAGVYIAIYSVLIDGGVLFVLPVGLYMYLANSITLTTFLMFMFIGLGLSRFMKQLNGFGTNITQILKGFETLEGIMNEKEIRDDGVVNELDSHDITFSNVSFGYGKEKVLNDINFTAAQNTVTALVGPSGAGKTTIGRLIPRFWDIDEGEIKIGGVNIKDIESDELMKTVSFVFQDVFMFNDTVLENIRMGDKNVTQDEVVEMAKKAQAHDFIMKLEDGYNTVIGAKGTYLSGGEKQRIAIARALVKDAPIIILDEATSYADTENEAKIQKALNYLLKDKTVLIIAHRLSTIMHADQILVFNEGKIAERGKHEEIMALNGLYKKMWEMHTSSADWAIGDNIESQANEMEESKNVKSITYDL